MLVACCDGVGTKVKLAAELGIFDTVGIDLVAMNVNDLVVQGAELLLFLDYIATPTIDRVFLHDLVRGIAEGCKRSGWRAHRRGNGPHAGFVQQGRFRPGWVLRGRG